MEETKKDLIVVSLTEEVALNIAEWKKRIPIACPKFCNENFVAVVYTLQASYILPFFF